MATVVKGCGEDGGGGRLGFAPGMDRDAVHDEDKVLNRFGVGR